MGPVSYTHLDVYKRQEIQRKERELERLTANGADTSEVSNTQTEQLKAAIEKFKADLNQLANGTGARSAPQVDYLKKCYEFYMQHNLYHLPDVDFSDCLKNILFYDIDVYKRQITHHVIANLLILPI